MAGTSGRTSPTTGGTTGMPYHASTTRMIQLEIRLKSTPPSRMAACHPFDLARKLLGSALASAATAVGVSSWPSIFT